MESDRKAGENTRNGWVAAALLTERWLARAERVDTLLEGLPTALAGQERARAQQLFFGVVRWWSRIEAAMEGLMARPPRTKVRAVLAVAGFELLEGGPDLVAKVIHHAVERAKTVASPKEAGLINAVLRKMAPRLAGRPATLAAELAHPAWLVERWVGQFGSAATRALLEWNQSPAPVYARWRSQDAPPEFLAPSAWPGFHEVKAGHWTEIRRLAAEGTLYLQDPSTRLAVEVLAPRAGELILDACAAPGGKALYIADVMKTGRLVALDLPAAPGETDKRLGRLKESLSRAPQGVEVALVEADLAKVGTAFYRNLNLPDAYDAVLVDAPCSNTAVMRHRVDVKWRLQAGDFARHTDQQLELLQAAARLVKPGGRLLYSTCSIDAAENDEVSRRFLSSSAAWRLERSVQAYPWIDRHDGAGVFLFRRA
ncbi:MAG TPA: transcription antitermination factor NusB [Lacunisphaera sp.]|nr:transcription antitermination factor NusB [Lacunisphaera sp.]